jgi:hypothetical protein
MDQATTCKECGSQNVETGWAIGHWALGFKKAPDPCDAVGRGTPTRGTIALVGACTRSCSPAQKASRRFAGARFCELASRRATSLTRCSLRPPAAGSGHTS